MKDLTILIAIILLSSFATSQVAARTFPTLSNEELQWWWHVIDDPFFLPKPHLPLPFTGKALLPPPPAGFHPPPLVAKCLSDRKDVRTCFVDIAKAFFTRKPDIGMDCCASIQKMNDDCQKTVFGAFHNPFFDCLVKLHCSTKAGSAPSPA